MLEQGTGTALSGPDVRACVRGWQFARKVLEDLGRSWQDTRLALVAHLTSVKIGVF